MQAQPDSRIRIVFYSVRAFARYATGWLTTISGETSPEVRSKLLLTLRETWFLILLGLLFTQSALILAFRSTHTIWLLALLSADLPVAIFRLWLHYSIAPSRRNPLPSTLLIASSVIWTAILAGVTLGLLQCADLRLTVFAVILCVGIQGYGATRFAAFPRLALLLLTAMGGVFAVGLFFSPFAALHLLAGLIPFIVLAFCLIMYSIHGTLLTAFRSQQQYRRLSLHDALTGLANRKQMRDTLSELCAASTRDDSHFRFAALCVDLDNFKTVNDRFGHAAGDRLLVRVSELLRSLVRSVDTVCRIGGDEFVILMPGATQETALSAALRLCAAGRLSVETDKEDRLPAQTSLSIGVALAPAHGSSPDVLLARADLALYQVKRSAKGNCRLYVGQVSASPGASLDRLQPDSMQDNLLDQYLQDHLQGFEARDFYTQDFQIRDSGHPDDSGVALSS